MSASRPCHGPCRVWQLRRVGTGCLGEGGGGRRVAQRGILVSLPPPRGGGRGFQFDVRSIRSPVAVHVEQV